MYRRLILASLVLMLLSVSARADVVILRKNGNGQLTPLVPLAFQGNTVQFGKTLFDLDTFDIDIIVTGIAPGGSTTITLTESVLNNTGLTWLDYHFTLGREGFGEQAFGESTATDNLFFISNGDQGPLNMGGSFVNPPMFDRPNFPDRLSWFAGNGLAPNTTTTFSVTINVPDGQDADGSARFTLRQQASVPEPTTLLLLSTGLAGVAIKTRKRLKNRKRGQGSQ
jgi:hypothetical protein